MARMEAKATRPRNCVVGEHITDVANKFGGTNRNAKLITQSRASAYSVGNLPSARAAFNRKVVVPGDWPDDEKE